MKIIKKEEQIIYKNNISTISFSIYDERFFELSKEAGRVYSASLKEFNEKRKEGVFLSSFDLQKHMKDVVQRENLHSDSFLAALQQVHKNFDTYKQAKKVNTNARPPHKEKFLAPIYFKQSQIKYKNGKLKLTINNKKEYILLNWNDNIPIPKFGNITYNKTNGWKINLCIEKEERVYTNTCQNKIMSIDPGVKRIATIFDGDNVILFSGKKFKQLTRYRNKNLAKLQKKLSKKEKGSNNYKKLKRAYRKKTDKLLNIQKDMLHKFSRVIVDHAIDKGIGMIVCGDNSSTHDKTNLGKKNNQLIQQFPERKLIKYIEYKFNNKLGISDQTKNSRLKNVSEAYTSQECPYCQNRNKAENREYKCSDCKFVYDRDGVGSINIYCKYKNVSFVDLINERNSALTAPIGVRYKNNSFQSYVLAKA